tara:strand:+ start:182 stop:1900 length:1719 start_codon:yes stop_codon:yes gene_type:complete
MTSPEYLSGGRIQGKTTDTASGGNTTYTISGTEDTDYTVGTVGANTTITITKTGVTTFTPSAGATVNYVVVGGGGGAGQDGHSISAPRGGGGGGAGAYRESGVTTNDTAFTSVAEAYTITIGTGGAGATSGGKGSNGTASSLNSSSLSIITSDGGGGGGGAVDNGTNEGLSNGNASGGGASNSGTGGAGGTYGYAGSNGSSSSQYNGGGGGGASATGANATTSSTGGGIGGAGRTPSTTYFSHSIIAGGGGGFTGGTGGSGGGGNASASGTVGIAGTANTGSGGGATGNANGGAGGTGIVILSFTTAMSVAADKSAITDVPVGTRYEETDTRKIFRRKSPITSEDDLTTDKGWVSNTGDWSYNAANDSVDLAVIRRTPTSQEIYIDLQDADYLNGSNLSDTAWIVRLGKIVHNSPFPSGGGVTCSIMISKSVQDSGTNQYSINLQGHFPSNDLFWRLRANSNTNNEGNSTAVTSFSSARDPAIGTSYLWEFKRDGNDFSATAYAESDTSYASPLETKTVTASGITALRYILITNDSEGANNSHVADIELKGSIKVYNGVTSADDVWTEKGTA